MSAHSLCSGHPIDKDAVATAPGGREAMQQLEAGHGITKRTVRVSSRGSKAAIVEDATAVGFADETDLRSNLKDSTGFDRYTAEETQPIASHIVKPFFADRWIRHPVLIGRPDKVRGWLPHPGQTRRSCTQAQGAVIGTQ